MKFLTGLPATLSLATILHMGSAQEQTACVVGGFSLEFDGKCDEINFRASYENLYTETICDHSLEEDIRLILGLSTSAGNDEVKAAVREICKIAWDEAEKVPFRYTHMKGDQFAQLYYNGGTYWNEEVETNLESETGDATNILRHDAAIVRQFYDSQAQNAHVEWPGDLPNFDLSTCEINAAMCCWPQDRQANDGNGNCNKPYDTQCYDKDPADNTDLCYVDLSRSSQGNKLNSSGHMNFPHDNNNGEGAIHCHGFAWANDDYDSISRFKANNLFYVSMYDHMSQRGYVRNIPGAPMCACVEQMPTVSRSDCTQIDVDEKYKIVHIATTNSFTAELIDIEIDFNACQGRYNRNNDLHAYVARLVQEKRLNNDQRATLDKYIVGSQPNKCYQALDYEMSTKGYVRGYEHDEDIWVQVAGSDTLFMPDAGKEAFRALFEDAPQKIVKRVCITCVTTHEYIYYKRLTPVPAELDLFEYLLNSWMNTHNQPNVDFKIYSTYEDAINDTNPWTFYNFRGDRGFPYESGPSGIVRDQWRRFDHGWGRSDVAFYVMKSRFESVTALRSDSLVQLDINYPKVPGGVMKKGNTYYITAGGYDIWGYSDQFTFLQDLSHIEADMTIKVHVTSLKGRDSWTKGGIMVRDSADPGAIHVSCLVTFSMGTTMHWRSTTGSYSGHKTDPATNFVPTWLMMNKVMNKYTCHKSADGVTWQQIHEINVNMDSDTAHIGIALTSHNGWLLSGAEGVFENFEAQTSFYPSISPTVSRSPTYKYYLDGVMHLTNVYSDRRMYASEGRTEESGVGAGPGHYSDDTYTWVIEPATCGIEQDCYTIQNIRSQRCLYAETGKDWQAGVGANLCTSGTTDISKWYLEEACNGSCWFIINAANDRRLYAQRDGWWESGVGAVIGNHCDDQKWHIQVKS
jgi:hypothetical protein